MNRIAARRFAMTMFALAAVCGHGAEYQGARISNGVITVDLYLPDLVNGSYRGTRFDWSGIIRDLTYQGHSFFGKWYDSHDPLVHDAITGPVDIFGSLGLSSNRTLLRIGVGLIEIPDDSPFVETKTYRILDPGTRRNRQGDDWIEFTHEIASGEGFSYSYTKKISLPAGKPQMELSYELRNTGSKAIDTSVFNHGFFQIDREPAGPALVWTFPFEPRTTEDFRGMAEIRGRKVVYLRQLLPGERVLVPFEGYQASAADHGFTLENRKSGAGVRITGDRPITKLNFWSRAMAYSPEASIHLHISPGKSEKWATRYDFYTMPKGQAN